MMVVDASAAVKWVLPEPDSAPTAAGSGEGVSHVERLKFPEITVISVQRPDAVLE